MLLTLSIALGRGFGFREINRVAPDEERDAECAFGV
jgi:hypothetical protein